MSALTYTKMVTERISVEVDLTDREIAYQDGKRIMQVVRASCAVTSHDGGHWDRHPWVKFYARQVKKDGTLGTVEGNAYGWRDSEPVRAEIRALVAAAIEGHS